MLPADLVELDVTGHVATVTLNRPDVLNAVSTPMYERVLEVFTGLDVASDVWCVVLRGRGRAFCVGADRAERATMTDQELRRRRALTPRVFDAIYHCGPPVIAQLHGYALGGGLELALACDLRVSADDAVLGLIETSMGSMPAGGGTQVLPRLVGPTLAKELVLTGRRFVAEEARSWGLLNRVVPASGLESVVAELAAAVTTVGPLANRQAKRALNLAFDVDVRAGVEAEAALYERLVTSRDRLEGVAAAKERRRPEFTGE
ncbi:enoyl-CoA hydratase-related protein [Phytoactinopolyspora limicola]|uniref:enoyl-CoA hydratase-related protein n=1 Tax=Phytoactinopolyspora limicola TaxID=2715536 RepID=UPI001FEA1475|nr:enoyl-CoA hydratase-related protein [Phytoactinopolyspora limicola]